MNENVYRQRLLNELETAEGRTEQLFLRLAAIPDEQSRYDYLSSERRDEIFVTDGCYWRMSDWFWFYPGKGKGIGYPVTLVGISGAKTLRDTLKLPAEITLTGLDLTVVEVKGFCPPVSPNDFQRKVECEVYDGINLRGLDVSKLIIPDSVAILTNISDIRISPHSGFPAHSGRPAAIVSATARNSPPWNLPKNRSPALRIIFATVPLFSILFFLTSAGFTASMNVTRA